MVLWGSKNIFIKKYIFISKIKTTNLKKDNQIGGFLIISIKLSWILSISKKVLAILF
ncbi:transposase [Bacillus cereus]|nr:transposase [Bacillus cereus]